MARIVIEKSTRRVDTLCEHMGGVDLLPNADIPETFQQAALRGLAQICEYCPKCGQKLHKEEPTTYEACSDCGRSLLRLKDLSLYCVGCGAKFDGSEEVAEVKQ